MDIAEGADIVMVKPPAYSTSFQTQEHFNLPVAATMLAVNIPRESGRAAGWIDEERAMMEILTSIRRAGADLISPISQRSRKDTRLKSHPAPA